MKTKSTAEAAEAAEASEKTQRPLLCVLGVSVVIHWPRLTTAQRI